MKLTQNNVLNVHRKLGSANRLVPLSSVANAKFHFRGRGCTFRMMS